METLNRILLMLFFMASLNILRHSYYLIQALFISIDEDPIKYKLSTKSLWLLATSIGYVLSSIVNGLTI